MMNSDAVGELIRKAHAGDNAALGTALELNKPWLLPKARQFIRQAGGTEQDVEDFIQDLFAAVIKSFPKFKGHSGGEFGSYLKTALGRRLSNWVRDRKRPPEGSYSLNDSKANPLQWEPAADQISPGTIAAHNELLNDALKPLTNSERAAVRLRYEEDWDLDMIAGYLGVETETAAELIQSGLRKLLPFFKKNSSGAPR